MLEHATIIALIVLAIHYTMREGEIFEKLVDWYSEWVPQGAWPAVFECNVCMSPWYGSVLYVIIWGVNWQWPIVVIAAMGINAALNKLSPDKTCGVKK